jgi:hypothetical protein
MTIESSSGGDPEDFDVDPEPVERRLLHDASDHNDDSELTGGRHLNTESDPGDNNLTGNSSGAASRSPTMSRIPMKVDDSTSLVTMTAIKSSLETSVATPALARSPIQSIRILVTTS